MAADRMRWKVLAFGAALAALAGCGSGSGGGTADPGTDPGSDLAGDTAPDASEVATPDPGTPGDTAADVPAARLGTCSGTRSDGTAYVDDVPGSDKGECNRARALCEVIGGGQFAPDAPCKAINPKNAAWGVYPFVWPYQLCVEAHAGEPADATGGEVCTWTLVSGCTEPGRRFDEYGSCADVMTQRPYGASPATGTVADDPRLKDAAYMAEVDWAAKQVEACACACCHTKRLAPKGPANWYVDAPGIWLDGVRTSGLALMLGRADSRALGAFPASQNNGFDRTTLGLPTTDIERMRTLLAAEWERRKLTDADAAAVPPFGGPLVEQFNFVPEACTGGEGVAADGTVRWGDGGARYLYILEAGSKSPVVPPDLDRPDGTIWLVQVPGTADPFLSGLRYGQVTGDLVQRVPASGPPPALESGRTYFLNVLADVGLPGVRCLFQAP